MKSGRENSQQNWWTHSSSNAFCPAATSDCVCRPAIANQDDYEIRVQVDFEQRLLRPLSVAGVKSDSSLEVLLFVRERCRPNCCYYYIDSCPKCRTRKLYQAFAAHPEGEVKFVPHTEYLYCMRLCQGHPVMALLSIMPQEQNVEVKELGLLAYWFATWFQRARVVLPPAQSELPPSQGELPPSRCELLLSRCERLPSRSCERQPSAPVPSAILDDKSELPSEHVAMKQRESQGNLNSRDSIGPKVSRASAEPVVTTMSSGNVTSKYLPNMRIVYQVRKNKICITMPDPNKLTKEIEILLLSRDDVEPKLQSTILKPSVAEASCELLASRNVSYTLMAKLKDLGKPIELLDLITERKVLRVQESREAPKFMNFLMERRVDQRATFVLHVTFDEKSIDVNQEWLGEFYLDVDTDKQSMAIGTIGAHKRKVFRVEKITTNSSDSPIDAEKLLVFEGSVDPSKLTTQDPIPIYRSCEYLISVVDPDDGTVLPTTVLCFQKSCLFVREIRGSDVRLHVTVQRDSVSSSLLANNLNNLAGVTEPPSPFGFHQPTVRRCRQDDAFHCPIGDDCSKYRILHSTSRRRVRAASRASVETAATASAASASAASAAASTAVSTTASAAASTASAAAADASCRSCGGGSSWEDSGIGCNQTSFSESQDTSSQQQVLQRRLQHDEQRKQRAGAVISGADFNVSLDVHLPTLSARLLRGDSDSGGGVKKAEELASRSSGSSSCGSGCFLIVEESMTGGRPRSVPCRLGETFAVQQWCKYTVKSIEERTVSPLFTFCLTDTEVIDVRSCHPMVRLTRSVAKENPQLSR